MRDDTICMGSGLESFIFVGCYAVIDLIVGTEIVEREFLQYCLCTNMRGNRIASESKRRAVLSMLWIGGWQYSEGTSDE